MPDHSGKQDVACCDLFAAIEFHLHAFDEVLGSPRWRDNSVSHCFAQLFLCCPGLLRDREVLGESVGAVDRHSAGDPDQLARFHVKDFCELIIQNMIAVLHSRYLL